MKEILVLAEHRMGALRDITFEMLSKGRDLAEKAGAELTAVLLGHEVDAFAEKLTAHADRVLAVEDADLRDFNAEAYQKVLSRLIEERKPILTMIGNTAFGLDLAPALAIQLGIPLATDCIDLKLDGDGVKATRQIYGGKMNAEVSLRESQSYLVTVRQATFEVTEAGPFKGEIVEVGSPQGLSFDYKEFVGYVEPPPGEVDIAEADILVSVGRGIRDEKNLPMIEELAVALKGEVGCSRPIVDKAWLPKDRQVGSSGKTVKPRLYVAVGISGSFQHVMGMKNSSIIVAVNKDPKAPIFRIADYGVVDDLFKIVPALTNKLQELKQ